MLCQIFPMVLNINFSYYCDESSLRLPGMFSKHVSVKNLIDLTKFLQQTEFASKESEHIKSS